MPTEPKANARLRLVSGDSELTKHMARKCTVAHTEFMARRRKSTTARKNCATAKIVVGYIRVSKDEQKLGLEAQREMLEKWCAARGATLVAVYTDHGVSGGAKLDKRLQMLAAVDALAEHGADTLLVAKRDRLARDTMIAAMIERLVERAQARIQSADGVGEDDTPESQLMRVMIDAFAQYERALIRARTSAALAVKRSKGEKTGGDHPYGYRSESGKLVKYEPEQAVLREARSCGDGMSLRAIGEHLSHCGHKPRKGNKWHPQTVSRLLAA